MAISSSFYQPSVLARSTGTLTTEASAVSLLKYARNGGENKVSAIAQLQTTLNNMDILASRQRIMAGAIDRIRDVASGAIEPTAEWEMTGGFLASTGVPFKVEVNDSGEVIVTPQEDQIVNMAISRQQGMRDTIERLSEVTALYDEETTKSDLRDILHYAVLRVGELKNHAPTKDPWEEEFQMRKTMGMPMMIGLTSEGDLDVFDQAETNFSYVEDSDDRLKLQLAMMELEAIFTDLNKTLKQPDSITTKDTATNTRDYSTTSNYTDTSGIVVSDAKNYSFIEESDYLNQWKDETISKTYASGMDVPTTVEDLDASDNDTTTISVDPTTGATTITTWSKKIVAAQNMDDVTPLDDNNGIVTATNKIDSRVTDANNYMTTSTTTTSVTTVPSGVALPDIPADDANTTSTSAVDPDTGNTIITTVTTSSETVKVQDQVKAATELWQYTALGKRSSGDDYFLDIDDNGDVVVRSNTAQIKNNSILPSYLQEDVETEYHIVPEYLRYAGEYDFYEASWEEDAMALYGQNIPMYLDVSGSQPKAKELDFNAIMLEDILSGTRASQLRQAQVSLLY